MAKVIPTSTLSIQDIANYRSKLDALEALVTERDETMARIRAIDSVLHDQVSVIANELDIDIKLKRSIRHPGSVVDRLTSACRFGASKDELVSILGVSPKTVEMYVYSSHLGGKLLAKSRRQDGTTIWTTR